MLFSKRGGRPKEKKTVKQEETERRQRWEEQGRVEIKRDK